MAGKKKILKVTGNENLDKGLAELPTMSNKESLDVALALQEILRQNQSILQNMDTMGDQLTKVRQRMDKYDKDAEKFNTNRESFINEVLEKANKVRATGLAKDKLIAKGTKLAEDAIRNARASQATEKLRFEKELAAQPKVRIVSTGRLETGIANGQPVTQLVPEEVRIKHKVWRLPIGQEVEVPQIVAERILNLRRSQQETMELQGALKSNLEHDTLRNKLNEISSTPGYSKAGIVGITEE